MKIYFITVMILVLGIFCYASQPPTYQHFSVSTTTVKIPSVYKSVSRRVQNLGTTPIYFKYGSSETLTTTGLLLYQLNERVDADNAIYDLYIVNTSTIPADVRVEDTTF